jgi:hypothetical protein
MPPPSPKPTADMHPPAEAASLAVSRHRAPILSLVTGNPALRVGSIAGEAQEARGRTEAAGVPPVTPESWTLRRPWRRRQRVQISRLPFPAAALQGFNSINRKRGSREDGAYIWASQTINHSNVRSQSQLPLKKSGLPGRYGVFLGTGRLWPRPPFAGLCHHPSEWPS